MSTQWKMPTKTKASFGESIDINKLAARAVAGQPVPMNNGVAQYIDISMLPRDLQGAMEMVDTARSEFMKIAPKTRAHFRNDVVAFTEFMEGLSHVEGARKLAIELGLVEMTSQESEYCRKADHQQTQEKLDELIALEAEENPPSRFMKKEDDQDD